MSEGEINKSIAEEIRKENTRKTIEAVDFFVKRDLLGVSGPLTPGIEDFVQADKDGTFLVDITNYRGYLEKIGFLPDPNISEEKLEAPLMATGTDGLHPDIRLDDPLLETKGTDLRFEEGAGEHSDFGKENIRRTRVFVDEYNATAKDLGPLIFRFEGTPRPDQVRSLDYKCFLLPQTKQIVLMCDLRGEATFILHLTDELVASVDEADITESLSLIIKKLAGLDGDESQKQRENTKRILQFDRRGYSIKRLMLSPDVRLAITDKVAQHAKDAIQILRDRTASKHGEARALDDDAGIKQLEGTVPDGVLTRAEIRDLLRDGGYKARSEQNIQTDLSRVVEELEDSDGVPHTFRDGKYFDLEVVSRLKEIYKLREEPPEGWVGLPELARDASKIIDKEVN
ncbi:MAG: hypothetical protein WA057_05170, partial [Candidatus Magasanikiibacteriota bacterium]